MRWSIPNAVNIMVILAPIFAHSAPLCSKLFQPDLNFRSSIPHEVSELISEIRNPIYPPEIYYEQMGELVISRLKEMGVEYEPIQGLGDYSFRIKEKTTSELGHLAVRIKNEFNTDLIVSTEIFVNRPTEGMVYDVRRKEPDSSPQFFLGMRELFSVKRALRSPLMLHELRHLKQETLVSNAQPSLFSADIIATKGVLPGFSKDQLKLSYSKKFRVDEIKAFYSELRLHLIILKDQIKKDDKEQIADLIANAAETRQRLLAIVNATDTSYSSLQRQILSNPDKIEGGFVHGRYYAGMSEVAWGDSLINFSVPLPAIRESNHNKLENVRAELSQQIGLTRKALRDLRPRLVKLKFLLDELRKHDSSLSNLEKTEILSEAISSLPVLPH